MHSKHFRNLWPRIKPFLRFSLIMLKNYSSVHIWTLRYESSVRCVPGDSNVIDANVFTLTFKWRHLALSLWRNRPMVVWIYESLVYSLRKRAVYIFAIAWQQNSYQCSLGIVCLLGFGIAWTRIHLQNWTCQYISIIYFYWLTISLKPTERRHCVTDKHTSNILCMFNNRKLHTHTN